MEQFINQKREKKTTVYGFSCNTSKLFKENNQLSQEENNILSQIGFIKFLLLITSSNECFIYSFRIGTSKGIKKSILPLINEANSSLKYGKYILDSDDDIDWEFQFKINYIVDKDIYIILQTFMRSLLNLAMNIMKIRNNKEKKNEKL